MARLAKRNQPETALHRAVALYLDMALPEDAWWSTFPSGGGGKARGAKLKGLGLKPGVPDILVIYRNQVFFIELKSEIGRLSKDQRETQSAICRSGGMAQTCRSLDDVQNALRTFWDIPLKATI